ncbi:hypothetical protein CYMTET_29556 [Cymbomonas tetramitiformis]|uniref:Ubiquitin-like domain-containing protein n=1 Tax=Cymbomonas tetramitiformis TaxID=36881 RepID=A0AAE0KUT8_9CHLO|nr:hypothetical protein CYMTET_29556 [Cymbomonas tetramitiformis]
MQKLCFDPQVQKLDQLPSLQRLVLSGNQISSITASSARRECDAEGSSSPISFPKLSGILLARNRIADWSSIDALNHLPALTELRLTENALKSSTGGGVAMVRLEIVARVAQLKVLNSSAVGPNERRDAEIRYLRRILGEAQSAAPDASVEEAAAKASTSTAHPRCEELVQQYGHLTTHASDGQGAETGTLSNTMLSLTLQCVAASAGERPPQTKKLPGSLTVGNLKLLCEKLFKVAVAHQKIFAKQADSPFPEELDDDREQIGYLGMRDGATILISDSSE